MASTAAATPFSAAEPGAPEAARCCHGTLFTVAAPRARETLRDLAEREKAGYSLARVRVVMADGSERAAVAFAALPGGGSSGDAVNPYLVPEGEGRSVAATARVIARSAGKSGKNIDYFRMLLEIMRARRVHDEHLEAIDVELARVAAAAVAVDGAGADGAAGAAQPQAST